MGADGRRRAACHEAGHALAARALGHEVVSIELGGPCGPVVGWQRRGARPEWTLNGDSTPPVDLGGWHDAADEIVIVFAGEAAEELAGQLPELDAAGAALAAAQATVEAVPIGADQPGEPWHVPMSDAELAERLLAGITSSEHEAAALRVALRCRALAIVSTAQFRAALAHLAPVLEQAGSLEGDALRVEIERAEVRASNATEEDGHAEAA